MIVPDGQMLGYKYLKAGGRSLCDNLIFPTGGLPQTVEHREEVALCHSGFHVSPSQPFALKYAVEGATLVATVELKGVRAGRYDKAVGSKLTLHSVEEDFAHPSQLEPVDCARLALHMVQQAMPLNPHPKVHQAIEAAENYLAGNSEEKAWTSRAAGIAALDATRREGRLTSSAVLRSAWAAAWAAANTWIGWDATWAAATAGYWAAMAAASRYHPPESYLAEEKMWARFLEKGRELLFKGRTFTNGASKRGEAPSLLSLRAPMQSGRGNLSKPLEIASSSASGGLLAMTDEAFSREGGPGDRFLNNPIVIGVVRPNNQENGIAFIAVLLQRAGLEVHSLGTNVPAERFVNEAVRVGARVVAMGVYTDDGISHAGEAVKLLREKRVDARTMVGGQGITRPEAERIGVDAYVENGHDAVESALRLMG